MNPHSQHCSFQNLLNSQQPNPSFPYHSDPREPSVELSASDASVFGSQWTEDGNEEAEIVSDRKERRSKWSPTEDGVLISAWLNTSKDPLVANEQKADAFWKRIAAYYAASPKVAGFKKRSPLQCKQKWGKINKGVCKFVGSYEAASRRRSSGQNDDDVLKLAHQIFYNDHKVKFTIEHAWLELCHDQKWCGESKRRKVDEKAGASSSYVPGGHGEDEPRPEGVKAAKAKGKKSVSKPSTMEDEEKEFQNMWDIRKKDFAQKQTLNKEKETLNNQQQTLNNLVTKTEPLTVLEIALKDKLLNEMLGI